MVGQKLDRILVAFESFRGESSATKEELAGAKEELKELRSSQESILRARPTTPSARKAPSDLSVSHKVHGHTCM
jgi:hypothetical protein